MLVIKSIEAIKEHKDYLKDKWRQARDNSQVKAKVKTVNKNYKKPTSSFKISSRMSSSMAKDKQKKETPRSTTNLV